MTQTDERELVAQAQHDPHAFGLLYDRYVDRIYAFAYRQAGDEALAADITSATFEQALRHLRDYRWQGSSFGAWLYRIARNELLQHYRRERFLRPLTCWHAGDAVVERVVETAEQRDELHCALARLSRPDREVLALRFFEELSSREVAVVLGISTAQVYLRVHRALRRLRKQFEAMELQGAINVPE